MEITVHVPNRKVRDEFIDQFVKAYFTAEIPETEMLNVAVFKDKIEDDVERIVCQMAAMLCICGERFAIYEDHSYHLGESYEDNVTGRLELDEYIWIKVEF